MGSEQAAEDSREEIMRATYRALCKHGYANLTMRNIAEEFEKSRALVHYHYDTKEGLMLAFLDRLIGWIPDRMDDLETDDPVERLAAFLDRFIIESDESRRAGFALALFELRMQAVHDERFRSKLRQHYEENQGALVEIIDDGVNAGAFRAVDPDETAAWMYATIEGARMVQVVLGETAASERIIDGLSRYVEDTLILEETPTLSSEADT